MTDYPKKELKELYDNLPQKLKEALFSNEISDKIYKACKKNGIEDRKITREISKHIGYVMLGLIPPNEFQEILEKEIKLAETAAKTIAEEINNSVFFPIKESLEALYGIEIKSSQPEEKTQKKQVQSEPIPGIEDKYREAI